MINIDEMWDICHDCPYWELCEFPYNCDATELKYKQDMKRIKERRTDNEAS